ncbi:hypothetical protein [Nonomuraea endophytica]|uniref:hypothetical protein n=1 Tax=Nonomuraea endophytica TaxID=714136 RepID=UPI0037CB3BCE
MDDVKGIAIDEAPPPAWAVPYFTADQLRLSRGLLWMLLIYKWRGRHPSRKSVAARLHVHVEGREKKEWDPSHASLAEDLDLSITTIEAATTDLETDGFILVKRRHNHRNRYRLAWPTKNVLAAPAGPDLCGAPTKKGGTCTWRAGRGTATPGFGRCKRHLDGSQAVAELAEPPPVDPQPLGSGSVPAPRLEPQPLGSNTEPAGACRTPTVGVLDPNRWGTDPQPLRISTPTVGDDYVHLRSSTAFESRSSPVLAVGEPPDVTRAGPRGAPAAQPDKAQPSTPGKPSFTARSITATIARYRTAPAWVRVRVMGAFDMALAAGFGRDAITRYAEAVIAEAAFATHQHLPELRHALRRLNADAALGCACRRCGQPGTSCRCDDPPTPQDRSWTADDQIALERALEHLGAQTDELAEGLDDAGTQP